jgi:hypothetical protein
MGALKRLCMFLFGFSGLVSLAVLALPNYGIGTEVIYSALKIPWVLAFFQACLIIALVGLVFFFLRAIFSSRNCRSVVISTAGGDEIQITRDAIRAQATHIIEHGTEMSAKSVSVRAKKHGNIRVFARVRPNSAINVVKDGQKLHDDLVEGLAEVCGDKIQSVDIEFIEPSSHEEPPVDEGGSLLENTSDVDHVSDYVASQQDSTQEVFPSEDITVSMGHNVSASQSLSANKDDATSTDDMSTEVKNG